MGSLVLDWTCSSSASHDIITLHSRKSKVWRVRVVFSALVLQSVKLVLARPVFWGLFTTLWSYLVAKKRSEEALAAIRRFHNCSEREATLELAEIHEIAQKNAGALSLVGVLRNPATRRATLVGCTVALGLGFTGIVGRQCVLETVSEVKLSSESEYLLYSDQRVCPQDSGTGGVEYVRGGDGQRRSGRRQRHLVAHLHSRRRQIRSTSNSSLPQFCSYSDQFDHFCPSKALRNQQSAMGSLSRALYVSLCL